VQYRYLWFILNMLLQYAHPAESLADRRYQLHPLNLSAPFTIALGQHTEAGESREAVDACAECSWVGFGILTEIPSLVA
jgi:hypothetical protein